jgi:hypothetical protein
MSRNPPKEISMRHETGFRIEAVSLTRLTGLAVGTRVATQRGEVAVESLRRGDWIVTEEGASPLLGAEARAARVAPVRIAAESLGLKMPSRDLLVGPATRLWLPRQSKPMEAFRLVDGQFVTEEGARGMTLWWLVFAGPRVVRAEGVEVCV